MNSLWDKNHWPWCVLVIVYYRCMWEIRRIYWSLDHDQATKIIWTTSTLECSSSKANKYHNSLVHEIAKRLSRESRTHTPYAWSFIHSTPSFQHHTIFIYQIPEFDDLKDQDTYKWHISNLIIFKIFIWLHIHALKR